MPLNIVRSRPEGDVSPSESPESQLAMPIEMPADEPLDDHPRTPTCYSTESDDADTAEGELDHLTALVENQRIMQRQAELLTKRVAATNALAEGQRRLEQQLAELTRQTAPRPRRRSASRGSPPDVGAEWAATPRCSAPRSSAQSGAAPRCAAASQRAAQSGSTDSQRAGNPSASRAARRREVSAPPDLERCDGYSSEEECGAPSKPKNVRSEAHHATSLDSLGRSRDGKWQEEPGAARPLVTWRPSARSAARLLSWRREDTLSRLHGDSPIYYAAWMAEWTTCILFTIAHLAMLVLWARRDGNQDSYVTTLFVTVIAAATYFAKACHMGDFTINGIVVPLARYIDWITTTPLMLYELCHIAHASFGSTFMVVLCDLLMLGTGIIAAMIPWKPHKGIKQIWFFLSCWFYVLMLLVIQFDVAKKAEKQNEVAQGLFEQLKVLTITVWSLYPIIVGIGRANAGLITKPVEDILLCVLDAVAKIGMEGLIVAACFQGCLDDAEDH